MTIRIKVKHLVLGGAAFVALASLLLFVVAPKLQLALAEKRYAAGSIEGKAALLRAIEAAPGARKWELIETHVVNTGLVSVVHGFHVIAGPGMTQTSAAESRKEELTWEERVPLLSAYVEDGPPGFSLANAAKQLALYYETENRPEEAASTLRRAAGRLGGARDARPREELLREAERLEASGDGAPGAFEGARVTGVVSRSDGRPVARVGVYLREEASVSHSVVEGEPYQALTDVDGRFSFEDVRPGSYQLYLGFRFEQIDGWTYPFANDEWIYVSAGDELSLPVTLRPLIDIVSPANHEAVAGEDVTFVWEPVEGAAYYRLNGNMHQENGSIGAVMRTHIREPYVTLPMEELYGYSTGISFLPAEDGREGRADPRSLLGFANPEAVFSWSVEAYDADGRMLSRSNGYRLDEETMGALPFFSLRGRELTEADRLLLDDRQEEALEAYQAAYERDPSDAHSLRMIVKLYQSKSYATGDRRVEEGVLPYLEALFELRPTRENAFARFHFYYERERWAEAEQAYALVKAAQAAPPNDYESALYAVVLMRLGKYEEARPLWEPIMEADGSHRFVGYYVASELLTADRPFEAASDAALRHPEHDLSGKADWAALVRAVAAEAEREADEAGERRVREALHAYFAGDAEGAGAESAGAIGALIGALRNVD